MRGYKIKYLEILNQLLLLTVDDCDEYTEYMDRVSYVYNIQFLMSMTTSIQVLTVK